MVVTKILNFFFITLTYHNLLKIELFCIVFYQILMYYLYFHVNKLDSIIYNKNKHMKKIDCNPMNHRHRVFCNLPSSPNFRTRNIPHYSIFGILEWVIFYSPDVRKHIWLVHFSISLEVGFLKKSCMVKPLKKWSIFIS